MANIIPFESSNRNFGNLVWQHNEIHAMSAKELHLPRSPADSAPLARATAKIGRMSWLELHAHFASWPARRDVVRPGVPRAS